MDELSQAAKDELSFIQGGVAFAGQIDPDALSELVSAGLVERYYEGVAGLMGCAMVRAISSQDRREEQ